MFNRASGPRLHSRGEHIWVVLLAAMTAAVLSAQPANPSRLNYATYAASLSGGSVLYGFAVDSAGYAYIGGGVYSGSGCAFLTKLNQTGSAALWSVCLPLPQVNAVAVDRQGYI